MNTLKFPSWRWENRDYHKDHPQAPAGLKHCYLNGIYSVQWFEVETEWGQVVHLMVRRHDEGPIREWTHMQRIKNELVGPERVAVEVYPAQSEVVDQANMYHLWVLPEGFRLPFGLEK